MVGQSDLEPMTMAIGAAVVDLALSAMGHKPFGRWKARHSTHGGRAVKTKP
jgi:hypothetical protein